MKNLLSTLIGIDPGRETGVAVIGPKPVGKLTLVGRQTFWSAYQLVLDYAAIGPVDCYIEDPIQNKPVWNRSLKPRQNLKVAQNVGMNKEHGRLLIEGLESIPNVTVHAVRPSTVKWDAALFQRITGYVGRSNQHQRDAARLIYGR